MNQIEQMFNYYLSHQKDKLFYSRLMANGKNYAIMYPHDKVDEIEKFVENFVKYFPYYIWNEDQLETMQITNLEQSLEKASSDCWNNHVIVPQRETKMNGIYGELFLDFYERIVQNNRLICTFAGKRSFKSNAETKGFDNILYRCGQEGIELIISEAKFVTNCSTATDALTKDIVGTPPIGDKDEQIGHLTKEFLNDYISFVVQKNSYFSEQERKELKPFFYELNSVLVNGDKDFVQYLIEKNIRVNCVFFAIFTCNKFTPEDLITNYDEIENQAKNSLSSIGITNYSIEIVFLPTHSSSMEIKGAIDEHYN